MTATESTDPSGDVHLRIRIGDVAIDYAASIEAVRCLINDWRRRPWFTIELILDTVEIYLLPRLPCERLYLGA
ncbi:hypothetical protein AB0J48_21560 [Nocardia salmonicida]|uniref:hypothetical protein n=1 Tax=Nocardia salmonicida TaxID=53431 RepID=UPI0034412AB3